MTKAKCASFQTLFRPGVGREDKGGMYIYIFLFFIDINKNSILVARVFEIRYYEPLRPYFGINPWESRLLCSASTRVHVHRS